MAVNVVAIDGPAASGKSTVAKKLAERLGGVYVNTGSMYRAVAWKASTLGFSPKDDRERLEKLLSEIKMRFIPTPQGTFELEVDGEIPGEKLRTPEISMGASTVATIPAVRIRLVELQRKMASEGIIVMEGRDICTAVFPDAKYKFFLTASPEERARRRLLQDGEELKPETVARVAAEIAARDKQDSTRAMSPLKKADDAVLIDNTGFTFEQTLNAFLEKIR